MELYKNSFKRFLKNKLLWIVLVTYTLLNMVLQCSRADFGEVISLLDHTGQVLLLCPQLLVLYLALSYEFFSEQYRVSLDESMQTTERGYTNKPAVMQAAVMVTILFLHYIILTGFVLVLTNLSFQALQITDVDHMTTVYIIKCLFINVFLIGLIGILLGMILSKIKKRIIGYAVIMAVVLITSYLLTEIATLVMILSDYTINLFHLLDLFNIMTPGLNFVINNALGFPMMTYRVCLIIFWILLLLLILFLRDGRKKLNLKTVICFLCCAVAFIGYILPSSRVDMGLSSTGSAMADQHYYDIGNYRIGEKAGNFDINKYTMNLDVRRLLKAQVTMSISENLDEYRFTLSHSYDIKNVFDETGKSMKYKRDGDALLIDNRTARTQSITVEYSGANEAYYSSSQGINLHGSFPYYPIPGYRQITDDGMYMNQLFLEKDAYFDISIKSRHKIYSNLLQDSRGHFVGKSNGATLLSGLYTQTKVNGLNIVYPLLNGWTQENLDAVTKAVQREGYEHCNIFITPNVNRQDSAVSKEQIITRDYFERVADLREFYPEETKGE